MPWPAGNKLLLFEPKVRVPFVLCLELDEPLVDAVGGNHQDVA